MTADRFQLPSGLTLVVQAQRTAPVAAFQIWVQAGAADERDGQVGLAHLHEHLLFKGTETTGPGELARAIEGRGGEVNAWTSHDMTAYHCVTASAYAREALEALADAVQHPAFDAGELAREIEVVCEEIKRSEDTPSRRASRGLFAAAFPHHPYGRPVLGDAAAVRSHTREKMLGFFQRHYRPERMVLSAVGDLDPAEVRAWATALFPVRAGPPSPRDRPAPAARPKGRVVRVEAADLKDVHVQLAFPAPSQDGADLAALDLLAMVLGQGQASALSLFVRQRGLASEASAWAWTPKDPGLFGASLVTTAQNASRALAETVQVLRRASQDLVDPDELRTAQENLESDSIYGRETAQGLARRLAFYQAQMGGLEEEARYLEAARKVTPASLREVARRTIDVAHAIVSVLGPAAALDEAQVHAALDAPLAPATPRTEPVPAHAPAAPARPHRAARPMQTRTLASGATVVVREERAVELVAVRATWLGGVRYETAEDNGLWALLSRTFTRGTAHRSSEALARLVDAHSASLFAATGRSSFSVRGEVLAKHWAGFFPLFVEAVRSPAFAEAEVARERARLLDEVKARGDRPANLAYELFQKALFQVHPYRLAMLGEHDSLARLGPEHLRALHRDHLTPSQLTLAVAGDVDADEVFSWAQAAFGEGPKGAAPPTIPQEPPQTAPREERRVLQKAQTQLMLGFRGARVTDPIRRPLELLATVLTGQSGRLFSTLRDQQSLAYSVSAQSMEGLDPGALSVSMGTSPEKVPQALAGLKAELQRLTQTAVGPAELTRAKAYLRGTNAIGLQRNGARAASMALDAAYGLGAGAFERYAEEIEAVTAEQVLEAARATIDFERSALAVVGP